MTTKTKFNGKELYLNTAEHITAIGEIATDQNILFHIKNLTSEELVQLAQYGRCARWELEEQVIFDKMPKSYTEILETNNYRP